MNVGHVLACSYRQLTVWKVAEDMGLSLGLFVTIVIVNWACGVFPEIYSTTAERKDMRQNTRMCKNLLQQAEADENVTKLINKYGLWDTGLWVRRRNKATFFSVEVKSAPTPKRARQNRWSRKTMLACFLSCRSFMHLSSSLEIQQWIRNSTWPFLSVWERRKKLPSVWQEHSWFLDH